jgi:Cu-Zn family superoxide dismutase
MIPASGAKGFNHASKIAISVPRRHLGTSTGFVGLFLKGDAATLYSSSEANLGETMKRRVCPIVFASILAIALPAAAHAADVTVDINKITPDGIGEKLGTAVISEKSGGGIQIKVDMIGVTPGEHGFHVHTSGDCAPQTKDGKAQAGLAAGPHYDPASSKSHKGPTGRGHKGDLPFLTATDKGINVVVSAPHLSLADVRGRTLMVHEGGDNYTDHPENGGGKARIACGVVPKG